MANESSAVRSFFQGRSVFITGATGFVGVALIEKILRDLPQVDKLYLLLRPKKGKTVEERLTDLAKNSVFDQLKTNDASELFAKLVAITGEIGEEDLGISEADRKTLADNVSVVFHSAATLDFFQSLKETTNINLQGTRRVMELCKKLPKLEAVVHVSSAYVNSFLLETQEILYPAPDDPEKIIQLADTLSNEALKDLEPKILKDHPNTYTFTKHLAEHEVNKCASIFPCGIVRPSMITASWKQPVPGWTISKNGPQGFFMAASKGVIRRLPMDPSLIMDYIPVDVVINQMLVTAYHVHNLKVENDGKPADLQIFHCTSSTYRPFRFEIMSEKMNSYMHMYPLMSAVWYPNLKLVKSLFLFRVAAIFYHFIPGFFLDIITKLGGGRPILIRLHKNVWNSLRTLDRFIFTEWRYHNKRTLELARTLNAEDKETFFIDIGELKWEEYFHNMLLGVRQYLNKEPIKNLKAAKRKELILLVLHVLLQCSFYYGVWKLIIGVVGISSAKAALILPIIYVLLSQL